ncbi:hypothetical protein [Chryseobacterium indologenes]|uniref:hypothetical protein n=1 Tax=Chryseobacterium indologenes TaxID=253 RepID=UPI0003E064D7|nr:hypothetical protein [Chryseobacterium indologenes]GAE63131.1 hypothetical protein CIN01S_02_02550 [Chryseobacterium indologenes NBRC 14944]
MRKILTFFILLFIYGFVYAQVGIDTTTPNGATVLDIVSNQKGILIPRLTDTDRDTYLADNNASTVPPAGVVNANLTAGTLILYDNQQFPVLGRYPLETAFCSHILSGW